MNVQNISIRKFLYLFCGGVVLTESIVLLLLLLWTKELRVLYCGVILAMVFSAWLGLFLCYFQKKLVLFTNRLCEMLDAMMQNEVRPEMEYEAETLLSKISHRMEQLYHVMRENRRKVEEERADLQSLVSDISHQTKTSIANLKMLNDTMMTREIAEETRREFLQAAGSQLDKLEFLMQAMVKTSRLETGVITMEKKETPISETVVNAINGVLAAMEQKQIALTVDCPEELKAEHDRKWTAEALFNLLDNAVKYTDTGGSIYVTVCGLEQYLRIDVRDTGRGIPESAQGAVFQRFFREAAVHDVEGIGIGLYLAREIITMQGGYIKVRSEVGTGSTFSVFLPYKCVRRDAEQ